MSSKYNIGDRMVLSTDVTPHPLLLPAESDAVTCTWTGPDGVARTPVSFTNSVDTTWWGQSATFDIAGTWRWHIVTTSGVVGADSGVFIVND